MCENEKSERIAGHDLEFDLNEYKSIIYLL